MNTVVSKDGTRIAFDQRGLGAPVILVDGALCSRAMGPSMPLAELLSKSFTVFTYDRRGRGDSGDTAPYSTEREVEDLEALITKAGGSVFVYGVSSGAALALETAKRNRGIKKLALYEAPFIVDNSRDPITKDYWVAIGDAIAADRRGDAVKLFLQSVGVPNFVLFIMRLTPVWPKLKSVAHTLPYDGALVQEYQRGKRLPTTQWASVTIPTLVADGGNSPAWMRSAMKELADVLPNAQYKTLPGQTHMVKREAHAPMLVEFFSG
jgi:pimeloyl-ACP methyl ester carboxylesterase